MVLGKLPVPGRPTNLDCTALAVGAGGNCLDIFSLVYHFSFLSPSLWETARYRLKYCLKGPLSPNNLPTNQRFYQNCGLIHIFICFKDGPYLSESEAEGEGKKNKRLLFFFYSQSFYELSKSQQSRLLSNFHTYHVSLIYLEEKNHNTCKRERGKF